VIDDVASIDYDLATEMTQDLATVESCTRDIVEGGELKEGSHKPITFNEASLY
jgi:hypothetical protein